MKHSLSGITLFAIACNGLISEPPSENEIGPTDPSQCRESRPANVPLRRLSLDQLRNTISDLFRASISIEDIDLPAAAPGLGTTGYSTEVAVNPMPLAAIERQLSASEQIAKRVADSFDEIWSCSQRDTSCRDLYLDDLLLRAFRRPPRAEETDRFTRLFEEANAEGNFEDGVIASVSTVLQSPKFLYQIEVGDGVAPSNGVIELTQWELAARLSYLFWDSMPDDELFAKAQSNSLHGNEIRLQAERLLMDPRSNGALIRFFREWTGVQHVRPEEKDDEWYPEFDSALAASMDEEFDRFALGLIRENKSLHDLLLSTETYIDAPLASFYGVSEPTEEWERIDLPGGQRMGILTKPALLATYAYQQRTSYVRRGVFVLTRLFCRHIPPPPQDATEREPEYPENSTNRETSEIRRSLVECARCHDSIDPLGLSFEHFDAIGKYRTRWPEDVDIDASGALPGFVNDGAAIDHVQDMARQLVESDLVQECVSRQWFRFTFGRQEEGIDGCTIGEMQTSWENQEFRIRDLMLSVVSSAAFRERVISGDES